MKHFVALAILDIWKPQMEVVLHAIIKIVLFVEMIWLAVRSANQDTMGLLNVNHVKVTAPNAQLILIALHAQRDFIWHRTNANHALCRIVWNAMAMFAQCVLIHVPIPQRKYKILFWPFLPSYWGLFTYFEKLNESAEFNVN
jgi:hypothetical protein